VGAGLSRVAAVAANTFRETVRQRVLYNLVFFALLMTFAAVLLGELSVRQDEKIVKDFGLAAMDVFGTLIALVLGVGLVSQEIERRSLYPLLAKPLSRDEFLLGRFLGLMFTLLVNTGAMAVGLYLTLAVNGRDLDPRLLLAVYAIFLALSLTVALALLFSCLFSSPALSFFGTFCAVVAGRSSDVVRGMAEVLPGAPDWLTRAVYYALPNFRNFDLKNRVVYGDPVAAAELGWLTLYAAAYVGVLLGVSLAAFRRRDFV
jgi:ABC-type transport system involved in multi-copper enzyme maturation permease subunit